MTMPAAALIPWGARTWTMPYTYALFMMDAWRWACILQTSGKEVKWMGMHMAGIQNENFDFTSLVGRIR